MIDTPLLDQHAIVYFGNDWFGENRTSSHHIARRLGARYRLLYVEVPGLRPPSGNRRDLTKIFNKLSKGLEPPKQIGDKMWHMTLPQVPYRGLPGVSGLNEWAGRASIRRAIAKLGFERILSWFLVPHPGFLAGQLGESMSVFYCIDDYSTLPGVNAAQVKAMDETLSRRVDLIYACSPSLVEAKQTLNRHVIFSPHGVDAEMFGAAADRSGPLPEKARGLKRPVVGFFGVLDTRFDVKLIEFLAGRRPDWTFLLVGRAAVDTAALAALPNVVMPGAVKYETLPDWARAFDICIMPYYQDAFSKAANPLKLREYLATGRAVVSVPTPEVQRFAADVAVAHNYEEFLARLDSELAADSPEKQLRRRAAVASMSWDARAEEVMRQAEARLGEVLGAAPQSSRNR